MQGYESSSDILSDAFLSLNDLFSRREGHSISLSLGIARAKTIPLRCEKLITKCLLLWRYRSILEVFDNANYVTCSAKWSAEKVPVAELNSEDMNCDP